MTYQNSCGRFAIRYSVPSQTMIDVEMEVCFGWRGREWVDTERNGVRWLRREPIQFPHMSLILDRFGLLGYSKAPSMATLRFLLPDDLLEMRRKREAEQGLPGLVVQNDVRGGSVYTT